MLAQDKSLEPGFTAAELPENCKDFQNETRSNFCLILTQMSDLLHDTALQLFDVGAVKFGSFKLKSGVTSPVYVDLRTIISHPKLLKQISQLMYERILLPKIIQNRTSTRKLVICGVPYSALTIATTLCVTHDIPMLLCRKEQKQYGTGNLIEGVLDEEMDCVIIEDVITSGKSITEVTEKLSQEKNIRVTDAMVFFNREQRPSTSTDCDVQLENVRVHAVIGIQEFAKILCENGRITEQVANGITTYIKETQVGIETVKPPVVKELSYGERAIMLNNENQNFARDIFALMEQKKSNLAVAADVEDQDQLLELAEQIGDQVVMFKTHIDILKPSKSLSMQQFAQKLTELAEKHNFLIFEDRKFADIGSVTKEQYRSGPFEIAKWAHITNCHLVSGTSSVVQGIQEGAQETGLKRGLLLIAKMSTSDTLTNEDTERVAVDIALKHKDFVSGFICQGRLSLPQGNEQDWYRYVYATPGVQINSSGDHLGQQYNTPEYIIGTKKSDLVIVGRGIYKQDDRVRAARLYRERAWQAYESRLI